MPVGVGWVRLFNGRREIEVAWVQTDPEIGRLIKVHGLLNQQRANYGAQTIIRLARGTKMRERTR